MPARERDPSGTVHVDRAATLTAYMCSTQSAQCPAYGEGARRAMCGSSRGSSSCSGGGGAGMSRQQAAKRLLTEVELPYPGRMMELHVWHACHVGVIWV